LSAVIEILHAILPASTVTVIAGCSVRALRHVLRYGPEAIAALVAIFARDQRRSLSKRAIDVLKIIHRKELCDGKAPGPSFGQGASGVLSSG
jgi:thiamine monophosphate synthase